MSTPFHAQADSFLGKVDVTGLDSLFSEQEKTTALAVRAFVDETIRPNIASWYEDAVFPREIVPEMGRLGVHGSLAMGAARDSFDAVLDYTMQREQFGAPLASYQLTLGRHLTGIGAFAPHTAR